MLSLAGMTVLGHNISGARRTQKDDIPPAEHDVRIDDLKPQRTRTHIRNQTGGFPFSSPAAITLIQ